MKKVIIASLLLGSIALGGCTANFGKIDSTADKTVQAFQAVCLALPTAHQDFQAVAAAFNVKQSVIDKEAKAYSGAIALCSSGAVTDIASAVKQISGALQQISSAAASASAK